VLSQGIYGEPFVTAAHVYIPTCFFFERWVCDAVKQDTLDYFRGVKLYFKEETAKVALGWMLTTSASRYHAIDSPSPTDHIPFKLYVNNKRKPERTKKSLKVVFASLSEHVDDRKVKKYISKCESKEEPSIGAQRVGACR
jgi:hypothetical protein